jgi:hypothetical protein
MQVSRPVAEYIAGQNEKKLLFDYQGEDTSLGIWLDESPLKGKIRFSVGFERMTNSGDCYEAGKYVIGHKISDAKMRECYTKLDEDPGRPTERTPPPPPPKKVPTLLFFCGSCVLYVSWLNCTSGSCCAQHDGPCQTAEDGSSSLLLASCYAAIKWAKAEGVKLAEAEDWHR